MTSGFLRTLSLAIGDHLWQTTVFLAAAAIVVFFLRNHPARIRYSLWLVASAKFLIPLSMLISLGSLLPKPAAITSPRMYSAIEIAGEPFSQSLPATAIAARAVPSLLERLQSNLPIALMSIWICGTVVVLLTWLVRWQKLAASVSGSSLAYRGREVDLLRRVEAAKDHSRPIPIRLSNDFLEPSIFGLLRPVLLWPVGLSERLDDDHIEAIMAHELIHVQRYDNLTAALHMAVEALFWFHPLVWWMERRMMRERERACDEAVLEFGGRPEVYAEGLLRACRFCVESPLKCVSGITGTELTDRVVSIMRTRMREKLSPASKFLLLLIGAAAVATPLALGALKSMQESAVAPGEPSHLVFEVASIKQSHEAGVVAMIRPYPGGDGYTVENMPLKDMISVIYRVPGRQIVGGPAWISDERFDIEAKADRAYSIDDLHEMFRNMLADRFHLKINEEKKDGPVYELTIAKSGLKMKPDGEGQNLKIPIIPGPKGFTGTNVPMSYLCYWLGGILRDGRPVVDKTGLTKNYDFTVAFVPPGVPSEKLPPELLDLPSIFDALKEDLGLQLTPARGPVPYYVIDQVDKPTPN